MSRQILEGAFSKEVRAACNSLTISLISHLQAWLMHFDAAFTQAVAVEVELDVGMICEQ